MPLLIFIVIFFLYIYSEISLLVAVGSSIGVFPLILLMIAISVSGFWLIRLRGLFTLFEIRKQIEQGKIPTQSLISSLFFIVAGILFIIPGFLSDILAILLLLPFTGSLIQMMLLKFFSNARYFRTFNTHSHKDDTIFDAEFERKQDETRRLK